jgi:lysophospholipase L1-like esterase
MTSQESPPKSRAKSLFILLLRTIFLFVIIEVVLILFGIADGEDYMPPRLVRIIEEGEIQGEFSTDEGAIFSEKQDGSIENNPAYWGGTGSGYYPHAGSMRRVRFTKTPQKTRYFLLGGSAALGQQPVNLKVPMNWKTIKLDNSVTALAESISISGQLESKLKKHDKDVEVLNTGIIAQDSGGLRRVAKQVLDQNPTGILMYLGNNEGIGVALGMEGETLPLVPEIRSVVRSSRLIRILLDRVLRIQQSRQHKQPITLHGSTPEVLGKLIQTQWRLEGKPLMENGLPTDAVYKAINKRFKENLRRIVGMAKEKNVQVYILPIAPHLGYPPFFDANDPSLLEQGIFSYSRQMEQANQAQRRKDWGAAQKFLKAAIEIDGTHATSWYQLGVVENRLKNYESSWKALEKSVLLDLSRKRALPSFAQMSKEVCNNMGCKTLDLHQLQKNDFMKKGLQLYDNRYGDHEHLTPEGCSWVADAFMELIIQESL